MNGSPVINAGVFYYVLNHHGYFAAQRQKKDRSPVEWDHVRSFSNQFGYRIICPGGLPSGSALCNVSAHRRESLQMLLQRLPDL